MLNIIKKYNEIIAIKKDISNTLIFVDKTPVTNRLLDYLNTECMLCNAIDTTTSNECQLRKLQIRLKNSRINYQSLLVAYQQKSKNQKKDYQNKLEEYLANTNMKLVTCADRNLQSAKRKKAEYRRRIEFLEQAEIEE